MKKTILLLLLAILGLSTANAQVGIGTTTPDASAILDVNVDNLPVNAKKGFLPPRMTTAERDAISSPAEGLTIYNLDENCLQWYVGNENWFNACGGNLFIEYAPGSVFCESGPTEIVEVQAAGHTWMDRNLGASRAATGSQDFEAYGDLYQWGRGNDGHQCINWVSATASDGAEQSNESTSQSASPNPGSTFITSFGNWYNGTNPNDLWKPDLTGVNNPCPAGYRVPSETELSDLGITNAGSAYSSIGLPMAGGRLFSIGSLFLVGTGGYYWSSTVVSANSRSLYFDSSSASMSTLNRAFGFSVRCLKD